MTATAILKTIDRLGPLTTEELARELSAPTAVVRQQVAELVFVQGVLTARREPKKVVRWLRGDPKKLVEMTA